MNKYITLNRDALVRLRQAKALSQEGLSWACQERGLPLSAATIKRAEAGRAILYRSARCFADYFDCPLGELTVDKPAAALGSLVAQVSAANPAAAATLLGRDFELQVFTQTLLRCEDENKGRLLCIRGVAGIGKSSLLSTFCGIGRDAGCPTYMVSLEQRQGHKNSFVRLLEQLFPSTATTSPEALYAHICDCMSLGSRERIHLALLLDVAPPSSAGTKPSARISSDGHVQVLIDIIRARHPGAAVVVMFEDIHWAAQDLLMNLKALSAGIHEVPVLMVLSTRPENDPIDTIWRSGLFNTPMHTLDLAPLSKTAARAVALAHADMDADYLEKILRQADGNPLFLQQLLLDYPDRIGRLPRTIQELVKSRLAGLDTASVKLASAAAVIGDQVDLDLLRHLLDTDHLDFDGLLQSQIVRSRDQSSMRFTHALICQGIYENTGDELKRELHGRAAKWFYGRDKRLHAQHLGLADSLQASRAFLVAAEEALGKHNFGAALSLIDSALLKPASPQEAFQFLLIKGLIFNKLDLPEKALSWFAQALALADSGDDRCEIHLAMAATYILLQRWKDATAQLDIAEPLCHGELNTRLLYLRSQVRRKPDAPALGLLGHCEKIYDQRQIKDAIENCREFHPGSVVAPGPARSVKVGVLHSQTGPLKELECGVIRTTLIAIGEINEGGGLLGYQLEPVLVDGKSTEFGFHQGAQKLLADPSVAVVFGSSTSSSRRYIRHLFEEADRLLVYPFQYEGMEQSENIFYIGPAPNQTALPAVEWLFSRNKRRLLLVGSDYVYPVVINALIRQQLEEWHLQPEGELYKPLGCQQFREVMETIRRNRPDAIVLTLVGLGSNRAFFQQLRAAGIRPGDIDIVSLVLSENDLSAIPAEHVVGTYSLFAYFQNFEDPVNAQFVRRYKASYGIEQQIGGYMESAYMGVYLWAKGVQKADSFDTAKVRPALRGTAHYGPGGIAYVDEQNNHTWRHVQLARVSEVGEFEIVWRSEKPIRPEPFPRGARAEWKARLQEMKKSRWNNEWELLCDGGQCHSC